MKVQQFVERVGNDLVLVVREHPSGREMGRRVWEGAARYLVAQPLRGHVELRLPQRSGLDIKPTTAQK